MPIKAFLQLGFGSVLISNSNRPVLASVQFPEALLKHPERRWILNIHRGELFSIRLQHNIKGHSVHAAAALAIADVLGYRYHAVNGVRLVKVT
jgi:hypothetical protein